MLDLRRRARESLGAFRVAARNRDLQRLQLAYAGSATGQWAGSMAVSVFAFEAAGAGGVALQIALRMLPAAVLAPFAGVLADRYRRERVMVTSDVLSAALTLVMAGLIVADTWYVAVLVVASLRGIVSSAFDSAKAALLPSLANEPDELTAANVISSTIESVSVLAGPALGAVLLSVSSAQVVLIVTAAGLLWSAALVLRIRGGAAAEPREQAETESILHMATAGFITVARTPPVRLIVLLIASQTFVYGALTVLVVTAAIDLLGLGKSGVGILQGSEGAGSILGALAAVALVGSARLAPGLALGMGMYGIALIVFGAAAVPGVAIVSLIVLGIGNTLIDVSAFTLLQRAAPADVLGRVFGVLDSAILATIALGAIVTAPLIDAIGIRATLISVGAILPALVLLCWVPLIRLDTAAAKALPAADQALLLSIPMFAPLSATTIEQLTRALKPVLFSAGEDIVRQGEPGDRFYILAAGEVEIIIDGRPVRREKAGDWFGEIALLRDEPRTATVQAVTDTDLRTLERDEFIAAVTGHAPSAAAAAAIVGARLAHARPGFLPA